MGSRFRGSDDWSDRRSRMASGLDVKRVSELLRLSQVQDRSETCPYAIAHYCVLIVTDAVMFHCMRASCFSGATITL